MILKHCSSVTQIELPFVLASWQVGSTLLLLLNFEAQGDATQADASSKACVSAIIGVHHLSLLNLFRPKSRALPCPRPYLDQSPPSLSGCFPQPSDQPVQKLDKDTQCKLWLLLPSRQSFAECLQILAGGSSAATLHTGSSRGLRRDYFAAELPDGTGVSFQLNLEAGKAAEPTEADECGAQLLMRTEDSRQAHARSPAG